MFVIDPRENLESGESTLPIAIICHPKTGSQSMQKALRENFKARVVRGMHFFDADECERVRDAGGIVACTVRNPWDLMVSWYFYSEYNPKYNGKGYPEPFKSWLLRTLVAGNGWIEKGLFFGADQCNRIFRFEHNLEFQLNNCLIDCGLSTVRLPHVAKTDHTHYSDYYDCETAAAVALRFPEEAITWNYSFDFPSE